MKFLIFLSIFFSTYLSSQEELTVVAIGEAKLAKEKLILVRDRLNQKQESFYQIFKNDFSFYRKLFSIVEKNSSSSISSLASEQSISANNVVIKFSNKGNDSIKLEVIKTPSTSLLWESTISLDGEIRKLTHQEANKVYKALTGKESIFLSSIVYVSDLNSAQAHIRKEVFKMDFDGGNKKRLTNHRGMVISPAVSPDGDFIVYSLITEGKSKNRNVNLYLMNLKNDNSVMLSSLPGINSGAVFTQDGENILLTLSHEGNAEIYQMNLKSKKLSKITNHYAPDVDPSINADGTLMTFLSGRPGKAMIYTADPRGMERNVKRISYVGHYNATPRFSPDGKEIAFSSWLDQRFDIFRIGSDGLNLVRLTKDFGSNEDPVYSPDGNFIAFSSQRVISRTKATHNIYIMDREGDILGAITANNGNCITPRWSK